MERKDGMLIDEKSCIVQDDVWGLNLSSLFSLLIRTAGRVCGSYASDVLYEIDRMKADLGSTGAFRNSRQYSNDPGSRERLTYRIGFRDSGVDQTEWVDRGEHEYAVVIEVVFEMDPGRRFVRITAGEKPRKTEP